MVALRTRDRLAALNREASKEHGTRSFDERAEPRSQREVSPHRFQRQDYRSLGKGSAGDHTDWRDSPELVPIMTFRGHGAAVTLSPFQTTRLSPGPGDGKIRVQDLAGVGDISRTDMWMTWLAGTFILLSPSLAKRGYLGRRSSTLPGYTPTGPPLSSTRVSFTVCSATLQRERRSSRAVVTL